MADTKILQAILDKVSFIEQNVKEISLHQDKTDQRIDNLGLQIAALEDDAPTVAEFDGLEKRVGKLETQIVST